MAWARYGGERGTGPLAAGLQHPDLSPPRRAGLARRSVERGDVDPPGRHTPAREARELAHPGAPCIADLPRDVPDLPVHGPAGDGRHARLRIVREDLDACPRLPGAR